jgi:hypothetical protein
MKRYNIIKSNYWFPEPNDDDPLEKLEKKIEKKLWTKSYWDEPSMWDTSFWDGPSMWE